MKKYQMLCLIPLAFLLTAGGGSDPTEQGGNPLLALLICAGGFILIIIFMGVIPALKVQKQDLAAKAKPTEEVKR